MMEKVSVNNRMPIPSDVNEPCNDYYVVWTKQYGIMKAMYLKEVNEDTEEETIKGWYTSYAEKLTCEVTHWLDEKAKLSVHQRMVIVKGICGGTALSNKEPKITKEYDDVIVISFNGNLDVWAICAISCDAEAFGLTVEFNLDKIKIYQK